MTQPAPPEELFHYTGPEGLIGLIKGTAWATMIHFLNDSLEFGYALELAREALIEELRQGEDRSNAGIVEDYLGVVRRFPVCAFCLSEEDDLLSQWRAYCPPEGGYAVAFKTAELAQFASPRGFKLVKCEYDRATQQDLIRPVVRELVAKASELPDGASGTDLHRAAPLHLPEVAAALKHPSFAEEKEWRLVALPPDRGLKYRPKRGLVVPYAEVQVGDPPDSSVARVVVGPHPHPDIAARAIRSLSTDELEWPLKVGHSESPFRAM